MALVMQEEAEKTQIHSAIIMTGGTYILNVFLVHLCVLFLNFRAFRLAVTENSFGQKKKKKEEEKRAHFSIS